MILDPQVVIDDFRGSLLTKYMGVASFTVLLWDHIITFSDEVEYIWRGRKGLPVYLFFLNRYLIPLSFIVNPWAYFRTSWTPESRGHFVRYEGSMTMIGISVVAVMMFVRVRALYPRVFTVQAIVLAILFTFLGINTWLLTRSIPVPHPAYPLVDSCTMIMDPAVGWIASSSAWLPLLYDTVVIALTLRRTASFVTAKNPSRLFVVMLQEGLLYYSVICTITLILTVMIISSNSGVRFITAQLELCLTVGMMSRITIHLRSFSSRSDSVVYSEMTLWGFNGPRQHANSGMVFAKDRKAGLSSGAVFTFGPRDGLSTVPEGEPSFLLDTFSGTGTTTLGTGNSSVRHASELDGPEGV